MGLPLSASTWEFAREVEASLNSAHGRTVATDSGTSPVRVHAGAREGGSDAFACILEEEEEEEEDKEVPAA